MSVRPAGSSTPAACSLRGARVGSGLRAWSPRIGLQALLQAGLDESIEVAVEHLLRVADLEVGAQILDAALVEHVAADLVAPADVGLGILELLLLLALLAHLVLVEAALQHRPRLVAIAVLRAVVLALHD